jgi:hypothetical protein
MFNIEVQQMNWLAYTTGYWIKQRSKSEAFETPPSGSVIVCTDPDPHINKQKRQEKPLISTVL